MSINSEDNLNNSGHEIHGYLNKDHQPLTNGEGKTSGEEPKKTRKRKAKHQMRADIDPKTAEMIVDIKEWLNCEQMSFAIKFCIKQVHTVIAKPNYRLLNM